MTPKWFVFNLQQPAGFADEGEVRYLYTNDPIIVLEQSDTFDRQPTQLTAVHSKKPQGDDPVFGQPLEWAYREYILHRLRVDNESEEPGQSGDIPLGNAPPKLGQSRTLSLTKLSKVIEGQGSTQNERLYLFNVIVALEWIPTRRHLRRLEWAFRRASDYLYDATNGCMAFGQVVFADSSWMDCADIQIMASNRSMPRSWVSGLLVDEKYTPIRVGRGVWVRNRRGIIEWDEPEGYRALVHEWGHYALGLKDEYLRVLSNKKDVRIGIVVPRRRIISESIMATPEGNSELDYPIRFRDEVVKNPRAYPRLNYHRLLKKFAGPGRLPLPLPSFRYEGALLAKQPHNELQFWFPFKELGIETDSDGVPINSWEVFVLHPGDNPTKIIGQGEINARAVVDGFRLLGAKADDAVVLIGRVNNQLQVFQHVINDADIATATSREKISSAKLILDAAEQTLIVTHANIDAGDQALSEQQDTARMRKIGQAKAAVTRARASQDQAEEEEAAIANKAQAPLERALKEVETVVTEAQASLEQAQEASVSSEAVVPAEAEVSTTGNIDGWDNVTPHLAEGETLSEEENNLVAINIVPQPLNGAIKADINVDVQPNNFEKVIFSLDGSAVQNVNGNIYRVATLDGYVLTRKAGKLLISIFSQGGGPESSPNLNSTPIAAGSGNGEALLFFYTDEKDQSKYAKIRVVTTTLRSLSRDDAALSDVFSIASNEQLPTELSPTLIIYYDPTNTFGGDAPIICRLKKDSSKSEWLPLLFPYNPPGTAYVAVPLVLPPLSDNLDKYPGGALVCDDSELNGGNRVEYFQLRKRSSIGRANQ